MGKENIMLPKSDYGTILRSADEKAVSPALPAYNRVYFDGYRPLHRMMKMSWLRVTLAISMSLLVLTTFSTMFATNTDKEGVMITRSRKLGKKGDGGKDEMAKQYPILKPLNKLIASPYILISHSSLFLISGISYDEAESLVLSIPNNVSLHDTLKYYTSMAHVAGTKYDYLQAEWTRNKFIEYGIADTEIEEYWPLLNYPKYRRVAIVEPEYLKFEAKLREDKVDEDETSGDQDAVPTFHGRDTQYGFWE